jgi:hypothetical protein
MHPIKRLIKYPNRISGAAASLNSLQRERLEILKTDGCLVFPEAIDPDRLSLIQDIYRTELEGSCKFKSPCLGQNLIDHERDRDLIERHFLCSSKELEERQLTFSLKDGMQYKDVIARFNPSTVTVFVTQIQELFKDWLNEEILALVESYMGVTPYLTEAYIRRNFPAKYKVMNHFWHRDINQPDYVLKAFIFLSDCALDNGPHEFVRGSVHSALFPGGDYAKDEDIDAAFPPDSEHRVVSVVKAGTIILEDTSGLHRAMVPQTGYRDLGYAVFVPRSFYLRPQKPLYMMNRGVYQGLSAYQKKFVPVENIN